MKKREKNYIYCSNFRVQCVRLGRPGGMEWKRTRRMHEATDATSKDEYIYFVFFARSFGLFQWNQQCRETHEGIVSTSAIWFFFSFRILSSHFFFLFIVAVAIIFFDISFSHFFLLSSSRSLYLFCWLVNLQTFHFAGRARVFECFCIIMFGAYVSNGNDFETAAHSKAP